MNDLPPDIAQELDAFVEAARAALGDDLVSAVLFGSAAEGRLRATSDVNLMLVLVRFAPERVDALREPLRRAHATIALETMLILDSEVPLAAEVRPELRAGENEVSRKSPAVSLANKGSNCELLLPAKP